MTERQEDGRKAGGVGIKDLSGELWQRIMRIWMEEGGLEAEMQVARCKLGLTRYTAESRVRISRRLGEYIIGRLRMVRRVCRGMRRAAEAEMAVRWRREREGGVRDALWEVIRQQRWRLSVREEEGLTGKGEEVEARRPGREAEEAECCEERGEGEGREGLKAGGGVDCNTGGEEGTADKGVQEGKSRRRRVRLEIVEVSGEEEQRGEREEAVAADSGQGGWREHSTGQETGVEVRAEAVTESEDGEEDQQGSRQSAKEEAM